MRAWYLVYSKPRQERVALSNLARQGYEVYLPLIPVRRRRHGRVMAVAEPMFPRYLFMHLSDRSDDWGPIRSTIGVSHLVRFGNRPARVPDDLVSLLREREDGAGLQALPSPSFRAGERVRIVEGVMAGYEAIFHAHSGEDRVLVLLEIADHAAKIQVDAEHVEPAERVWPTPLSAGRGPSPRSGREETSAENRKSGDDEA
jgi:transcriptional antiterminator RfaH